MYSALVSLLIGATAGGIWTALDLWKGWAMGIVLLVLVFFLSFFIISRILARRLEPQFLAIQKQIQAGATEVKSTLWSGEVRYVKAFMFGQTSCDQCHTRPQTSSFGKPMTGPFAVVSVRKP